MTLINVDPLVLKDVDLVIGEGGTNQYQKHVSSVIFTPTAAQITWQGLHPDASFTDTATATWAAALTYVQDWETVDSLSRYLYEHEGETVPVVFKPRAGSGPSFTSELIIVPGAIGGAVNTYGETTVTLGAQGRPVLAEAVATPAWAATTAYVVGDRVTIASGTVRLRAVIAGTSDAVEPAVPAAIGQGDQDATVTWVRES